MFMGLLSYTGELRWLGVLSIFGALQGRGVLIDPGELV